MDECDIIREKIKLRLPAIPEPGTIEVDGLDLQADGATHVANRRDPGATRVTGDESKGRINKRIRIELAEGGA